MTERQATGRRRKLKVYTGNLDGKREAIAACHSIVEFRSMTRISRDFMREARDEAGCAAALARPGAVFTRPFNVRRDVPWELYRDAPAAQPRGAGADGGEG